MFAFQQRKSHEENRTSSDASTDAGVQSKILKMGRESKKPGAFRSFMVLPLITLYLITLSMSDARRWIARTHLLGGLSNRLLQLAALVGYCERTGVHFPVVYDADIRPNPHGSPDAALAMFPMVTRVHGRCAHGRCAHALREQHFGELSPYAAEPIPIVSANVLLTGYRQAAEYHTRADGTFILPQIDRVGRRAPCVLFPHVAFERAAFIHIRRGDYVASAHELPLQTYYEACIEELLHAERAAPYPSTLFIILLSNDPVWAEAQYARVICDAASNVQVDVRFVCEAASSKLTDVECLAVMAACAMGGVCANSSLSWWGSLLGHVRHGVQSYFPSQWAARELARHKVDFPPWARVRSIHTGMIANCEWHSTRLDKRDTYELHELTGIAARCDWFVHGTVVRKRTANAPKTCFISTYLARTTFAFFTQHVLPTLTAPLIVVLASEDATFPCGTGDARPDLRPFEVMQPDVLALVSCPLVTRIYVENLDWTGHPKLHALPLGVLPYRPDARFLSATGVWTEDAHRSLAAFCAHRVREGPQWEDRKRVSALCAGPWAAFTTCTPEVSYSDFITALQTHTFALCVHGGGLDPSPRAWEVLLSGCIPILARSTVSDVYSAHFPCVVIDAWTEDAITQDKLRMWQETLKTHFMSRPARQAVLNKLTLQYWWSVISTPPSLPPVPLLDEFVFFPMQDIIGHDLCPRGKTNVLENAAIASADPSCIGFNSLGFMKHTVDVLSASPYLNAPHMGIYIKKTAVSSLKK